jgi:hypothetical protein
MNKKRKLKHSTKLGTGREKWNHNIGVDLTVKTIWAKVRPKDNMVIIY